MEYEEISLWLINNDTDGLALKLQSFSIDGEGILQNEEAGPNTCIAYSAGKQSHPKNFNQIHITESMQTQRYIVKYISNEYQADKSVMERLIRIQYYSMHANSLSVTVLRNDKGEIEQ